MLTRYNLHLINIFLTLSGVILFLANPKEFIIIPGLLLISILLMIIPYNASKIISTVDYVKMESK